MSKTITGTVVYFNTMKRFGFAEVSDSDAADGKGSIHFRMSARRGFIAGRNGVGFAKEPIQDARLPQKGESIVILSKMTEQGRSAHRWGFSDERDEAALKRSKTLRLKKRRRPAKKSRALAARVTAFRNGARINTWERTSDKRPPKRFLEQRGAQCEVQGSDGEWHKVRRLPLTPEAQAAL